MYKGQENYRINSCDTIEIFYNIRTDWDKLKIATEITKIIQDVTTENENTYKILQLYLNTLYMISETDKNLDFILAVFKLKLLCFLGFKPHVEKCTSCDKKENLQFFCVKDDGCKCEDCGKLDKSAISIGDSTLIALKYIVLAPTKKLFSFELKNESLKQLELLAKVYFEHHGNLEIPSSYKTLNGYEYTEEGIALGRWIANQRQTYKGHNTQKITETQIKLLEKIRIKWFLKVGTDKKSQEEVITEKNSKRKQIEMLNRVRSYLNTLDESEVLSKEEINQGMMDVLNHKIKRLKIKK